MRTVNTSFVQQCKYFIFLTVLLSNAKISHQFASWLVDREVACYAVIRDPEEIIMNNPIKLVEKSAYPDDVYIEVLDIQNQKPLQVNVVDGRRVVYIEETTTKEEVQNEKYILRLITHPSLQDLQYVMDVMVLPERDEYEEDKKDNADRMAGNFSGGTTGCGDSRAHGRAGDGGLVIQVSIPSSLFSVKGGVENAVEVVAVWACGHEAVTLTHPIFFLPKGNSINIDVDTQHGIDARADIDVLTLPEEGVQDPIVSPKEEQDIQDEKERPVIIEHASEAERDMVESDAATSSQDRIAQNGPDDEQKQTNHHTEEEIENNAHVKLDAVTDDDASQQKIIQNEAVNEQKQTEHHTEEEIENNNTKEMDAIMEGLNKVEQVIQNNSPEKMDAIMEGLNKVEELIQNNGVGEIDAIMDGLNKVEDLIENESPEEMDAIKEGLENENMDTVSDTKNNLRQRIRSDKIGGELKDTPPTNHHDHGKAPNPKHKKHHRPDPLDTPIRRFRKKYDEEDFGMGSFDTKSYLLGLCVFASGNFVLFPFLFAIKRRYGKGRLD